MIIIWRDNAKYEFKKCARYIAEKSSVDTAERWQSEVEKSLKTLEVFPFAGRKTSKYRKWQAHKNYYALYETYDEFVYIIHFRHSKRKPLEYKAKKRQNPDSQDYRKNIKTPLYKCLTKCAVILISRISRIF